ncbi:MAG: DUF5665 domain-containing protein [bacterium]|nr:DUF5665 domain-containing protein [bacterium]
MEDDSKERYNQIYRSKKQIMLNNFLGGIAWSFGTLIGAGIIVFAAGFFFSRINLIPIIGFWIQEIIKSANIQQTLLLK